jgi:flagellar basal body rod protein FlgC
MNLSDQMTHMLIAQRAYQANVSAFRAGRDAYLRALEIGR